jgi:oxygen-independent coproporphyrinogen-3 oxidase
LDNYIPEYIDALCEELSIINRSSGKRIPVHTIFLGGGTPSLMSPAQFEKVFKVIQDNFALQDPIEITMEANPGTVNFPYLAEIRRLGINRLSLGVQSANTRELKLLERQHSFLDVVQAVHWARKSGFSNINLDLIYGIPYQDLTAWQRTLDMVLQLNPEHLSLYALTLEHGTPLYNWVQRGLMAGPDDDLAASMYEWAQDRLERAGLRQYEISNWAAARDEGNSTCRHNLQYWLNLPYLGSGAGAHGYIVGLRTANVLSPQRYVHSLLKDKSREMLPFPRTPATRSVIEIDRTMEIGETMMVGLRLVETGVSEKGFRERFGIELETHFSAQIKRLSGLGLLQWSGTSPDRRLHLTRRGLLLGNQVFVEFI